MGEKEELINLADRLWDDGWYLRTREWPDGQVEHIIVHWDQRTDDGQYVIRDKLFYAEGRQLVLEKVKERARGVIEGLTVQRGHDEILYQQSV